MSARVGRHVTSRIRARGWLRTESPLHVGGLGHDPSEPLPIALDGLGRLYVPGTTLAGVLRNWSRGTGEASPLLDRLWGFVSKDDSEEGSASRMIVADALVTTDHRLDERGLPASPLDPIGLELRQSVGIDRVTGTAAQEFLYGRTVVPAGCYLRLEIDVESRTDDATGDEARLGALLAALSAGEVRIGAATGRGLGRYDCSTTRSSWSWTGSTPRPACWPCCGTTRPEPGRRRRCGPPTRGFRDAERFSTSASPGLLALR
ncbi:RAMP superfamily CRISPR-associated protein [Streptosporangium sp. G11]|uniref:RAMP superfamily CRISPR-associated protein n=1 Tax=Streptosporangium sp. G11 TaxID=3436926 RepID=UPI003EBA270E